MSSLVIKRFRNFLLLAIWFVGSLAADDIEVPYNQLIYLPSRASWVEYADDVNCPHIASNANDAAVQYTFTGSAIAFNLPRATNGANVSITFSDGGGSTWYHDTFGEGCDSGFRIQFPQYQFKPLMVTLRPSGGLFLNVRKFVVTSLSIDEQNSLSSLASISTASVASLSTSITSTSQTQITTTQPLQSSSVETFSGQLEAQTENKSSSNTAVMVGGILGGILGAMVIGILVFFWLRKRRRQLRQKVDLGIDLDPIEPASDSELMAAVPSPWVAPNSEFDAPPPEYSAPSSSTPVAPWMQQSAQVPALSSQILTSTTEKGMILSNPSSQPDLL